MPGAPFEPFRLLSAVFVHMGVLHFGMNMVTLGMLARAAEPAVGSARFAIAYVLTGLFGFGASAAWNLFVQPEVVCTAGASGAVFGVMGLLLGWLLRRRDPRWKDLALQAVFCIVLFGFVVNASSTGVRINNAAHIGGLASGALLGLSYAGPARGRYEGVMNAGALASVLACLAALVLAQRSPVWRAVESLDERAAGGARARAARPAQAASRRRRSALGRQARSCRGLLTRRDADCGARLERLSAILAFTWGRANPSVPSQETSWSEPRRTSPRACLPRLSSAAAMSPSRAATRRQRPRRRPRRPQRKPPGRASRPSPTRAGAAQDPEVAPAHEQRAAHHRPERVRQRGRRRLPGLAYVIPENTQKLPSFDGLVPFAVLYTDKFEVKSQDFSGGFRARSRRTSGSRSGSRASSRRPRKACSSSGSPRTTARSSTSTTSAWSRTTASHSAKTVDGEARLTEGTHRLRLDYFQAQRGQVALLLQIGQKDKFEPLVGLR